MGFEGFDGLRAETFLANVTSSCGRSRVWRRLERSIDLSWVLAAGWARGRWAVGASGNAAGGDKGVGYLAQAAEGGALRSLSSLALNKNGAIGDAELEAIGIAKAARDLDEVSSEVLI